MIRKATANDLTVVAKMYDDVVLYEKEHTKYTIWQTGVYPTIETAKTAYEAESLYVYEEEGEICASVYLDNHQPQEYDSVDWPSKAKENEYLVVVLLCVDPLKAGRGIGQAMMNFIFEEGKRRNLKAVRLDTAGHNLPAIALYQKLGFDIVARAPIALGGLIEDSGHLFLEKSLQD
ncbi:GNAT family N-acetyltransferase [Anaerovorax odorimutans]|uniref:GNAT family N-acetyltransferase n=1 Tax=Anaerovorax odorimutans TaxID=109327 RepID=A0ABT1RQV8_9FIRM|nr:GNAT family N-acetyltransferase [Anaerovorax odorimutans]MCQ4637579.1 GNAT family N-acetyltransferase [Anaerovorax odorimutans]